VKLRVDFVGRAAIEGDDLVLGGLHQYATVRVHGIDAHRLQMALEVGSHDRSLPTDGCFNTVAARDATVDGAEGALAGRSSLSAAFDVYAKTGVAMPASGRGGHQR
jgi:hypothetical protein